MLHKSISSQIKTNRTEKESSQTSLRGYELIALIARGLFSPRVFFDSFPGVGENGIFSLISCTLPSCFLSVGGHSLVSLDMCGGLTGAQMH